MTNMEKLINEVVERSLITSVARKVDATTEELADDIWKEHKNEFNELIRRALRKALDNLGKEVEG